MIKHEIGARAPRLPGLSLIRAFAIVWVMFYHAALYDLLSGDNWFPKFGWMGVDLFFVLSGFLIAGQLLRPFARGSRPDYRRFFERRALRTLPAYLVVVAAYFTIPAVRDRTAIQPLWQFLTFTENLFVELSTPKAFSHVWSLCVEEQFYVVLPCLIILIARKPSAWLVSLMVAAALLGGMAIRGWLWLADVARVPFDAASLPHAVPFMRLIYYPTWCRLDGLVVGIAAASIQLFRPTAWRLLTTRPNLLLGLGVMGVFGCTQLFGEQIAQFWPTVLGFPLLSVSIGAIVVAGSSSRSVISRWSIPGADALAAGAYSLYLSHKAVYRAVAASTFIPDALKFPVALCAAMVVGALLFAAVERPFLRVRDKLDGRSRTSLAIS